MPAGTSAICSSEFAENPLWISIPRPQVAKSFCRRIGVDPGRLFDPHRAGNFCLCIIDLHMLQIIHDFFTWHVIQFLGSIIPTAFSASGFV